MERLTVKLISDFREDYDHWFDSPYNSQLEFRRMTTEGPSRSEMFELFENNEILTPKHGVVKDMFQGENSYRKSRKTVVVYLDDKSHCGENKIKLSYPEALIRYPNNYCSQYIRGNKQSWRYLQIGERAFLLLYSSDDEWRSNCGDVNIEVLGEVDEYGLVASKYPFALYCGMLNLRAHHVLFAVDFVNDCFGNLFAVDFNVAPGIKHTGIDLAHKDIADLIIDGVNQQYTMQQRIQKVQQLWNEVEKMIAESTIIETRN